MVTRATKSHGLVELTPLSEKDKYGASRGMLEWEKNTKGEECVENVCTSEKGNKIKGPQNIYLTLLF